jgi:lipid-binding SYLF domain-containing protein
MTHRMTATFGYAERDTVIVLNHFAMKKLFVEGNTKLSLAEDIGACAGPVGASAASAIAASEKAGGATAFVYTYQKGVMLNVEATAGLLWGSEDANKEMYGTNSLKEILEGKASPKDEEATKALVDKVAAFAK